MLDIINKEEDLGLLDDLGKLANGAKNPLELAYQLNEFELGLEAAKIAKEQEKKEDNSSEKIEPDELLRGIQRDMQNGNER